MPNSQEISISGNQLVCPVCKSTRFWSRETLMNTVGATFFNFDWTNRAATNYICSQCGYIYWFLT